MSDEVFPTLYLMKAAAPSRAVLLTAAALGITLKEIEIDLMKGEHTHPDFLKMNPQHTVPTLNDNGKAIWDSHAINIYLVTKYGKKSDLYPDDPYQMAVINQRLYFDTGVFFPAALKILVPLFKRESRTVASKDAEEVVNAYKCVEDFLNGQQWVASDNVTIADFSLLTMVTNLSILVPIDAVKFPNITAWRTRAKALPYYYINEDGGNTFKKLVNELISNYIP